MAASQSSRTQYPRTAKPGRYTNQLSSPAISPSLLDPSIARDPTSAVMSSDQSPLLPSSSSSGPDKDWYITSTRQNNAEPSIPTAEICQGLSISSKELSNLETEAYNRLVEVGSEGLIWPEDERDLPDVSWVAQALEDEYQENWRHILKAG